MMSFSNSLLEECTIMIKKEQFKEQIRGLEDMKNTINAELNILRNKIPTKVKLRAARVRNSFQYSLRPIGTSQTGIYIKEKDIGIAKDMAKVEYYEKLLEEIEKELEVLEKAVGWEDSIYLSVLKRMTEAKQNLLDCPFKSDDEYIISWLQQEYEHKEFRDGSPEYYTKKGVRVRSKTEVIISDILSENGVPYLYEKPLKLKRGVIHPDFTLLNIRDRREVYWEHFGMMEDIEYRDNVFIRIRSYENNGLYQGESTIWTFESSKHSVNIKDIRDMVKSLKVSLGY